MKKSKKDKNMLPKISTKFPFNYEEMISKAKYAFLYDRCGNQGSETRPYVVLNENKNNGKCEGYGISIYKDGIEINSEFSMPKDWINNETLTTDVNTLICEWLIKYDNEDIITF